ncbi:hypothetical protein Sru01_13630 [Sphaerisporangium rufum]|uniref:Fibronectin type-III domain-containing protein n=1 Tax=Sphaerisporangium rufum TaxID=1381558 RepID=A0A919R0X4_9ACTN|nr:hypothetical protein Sru01_13630 [Sphaerisporangium rufum]
MPTVVTVSAVAVALLVPGGALPARAEPTPAPASSEPVQTPFPRPEDPDAPLRAAVVEAKKQGRPVEVVSAFTEASRTWAYPDGRLTTESYSGPAQVKRQDGSWAWIDTTLAEKDGVLKPKVAKADLAFSLGGDGVPFAVMKRDAGQSLRLSWEGKLPRPVVAGNVATYPGAAGPGADLVVTALPAGFRHDVVLRQRPTGPLEIRIPVESPDLTLGKSKQGGLELLDGKDKVVAQAPPPVMWDSTGVAGEKAAGQSTDVAVPRSAPIATSVVERNGRRTLVLKPDAGWLADPATTFPVVVDPTSTLTVKTDTLLSNGADCNTYDQPGATLLKIGAAYYTCRGVDAMNYWRSYLKFDVGSLAGKPIVSSTMQLWRTESPGCHLRGTGKIYATRLSAGWTAGQMTWSNKPAGGTDFVSTPCPTTGVLTPGVMTWPITGWVKAWTGGQPNYGVELSGPSESVGRTEQYSASFHSAEMTGTGATPPKLITQYILPPGIPTVTAESVDSMDGDHAIIRKSSAKVGYSATSVDGRNIDYYASVVDSTAPLPTWTTGGGESGKWSFTEGTEGEDSSGNGNPLGFVSGRYSIIDGKDGKALSLNGAVGVPSFANTQRPVLRTDKSFSVAGWVRLDSGNESAALMSQDGANTSAFVVGYDATSRKWTMLMRHTDTATAGATTIKSSSAAQIGVWTHLTGVYDAGTKKLRLYVNGVQAAEGDHTVTPWRSGGIFSLGYGNQGGYAYPWVKAGYDEIRAYNRALSPTEIQWMLNLTPPTNADLPSGQPTSITYDVGNVDSFKISIRACIHGATPLTCSESPYYRITTDAPYLPTDTETGMADPTQPILSGMVNRPSGGPVTAKFYLYDSTGAPVGAVPLGERTVGGGDRASFQLPANIVRLGAAYTWQMIGCAEGQVAADEVCTSKTAPVLFTTPGTSSEPQEDVRQLNLRRDNFIIKTAQVDPTACDGGPCAVADTNIVRIGGTQAEKTASVIGFRTDELPNGAGVSEAILRLGTPVCPAGACPAGAVITATPLKDPVTAESKGSELAGNADPSATPYSLPLTGPQADIAGSEYQWLLLTGNVDDVITFGDPTAAEQPSLDVTYLPAGPPGKVLNLVTRAGDAGAIASWGIPEDNGGVALLDGYDVEVAGSGGDIVKTLETTEPYATISGLTNDEQHTVKVRARTAFGIGEWESATVTPKKVPPAPAADPACVPFLDGVPPSAARTGAATESGAQAYVDRVLQYYQAQDAVLDGESATVWDVPGVTPDAPSTAKLSLLNASLVNRREGMAQVGESRTDVTADLPAPVVEAAADGTVRVVAEVKRSWKLHGGLSGDESGAAAAHARSDQSVVEPGESTISIHVFDRCGYMTHIQVANPAYQDETDVHDPGPRGCGTRVAFSTQAEMGTARACSANNLSQVKVGFDKLNALGKTWWVHSEVSSVHATKVERWDDLDWDKYWRVDYFANYLRLFTTDAKMRVSAYGKYLRGHVKFNIEASSCFENSAVDTEVGIGLSIGPKEIGGEGSVAIKGRVGEKCQKFKLAKVTDPALDKIHDVEPFLYAKCLQNALSFCTLPRFTHFAAASLVLTYKKNGTWYKDHKVKQYLQCEVDRRKSSPVDLRVHPDCWAKSDLDVLGPPL